MQPVSGGPRRCSARLLAAAAAAAGCGGAAGPPPLPIELSSLPAVMGRCCLTKRSTLPSATFVRDAAGAQQCLRRPDRFLDACSLRMNARPAHLDPSVAPATLAALPLTSSAARCCIRAIAIKQNVWRDQAPKSCCGPTSRGRPPPPPPVLAAARHATRLRAKLHTTVAVVTACPAMVLRRLAHELNGL